MTLTERLDRYDPFTVKGNLALQRIRITEELTAANEAIEVYRQLAVSGAQGEGEAALMGQAEVARLEVALKQLDAKQVLPTCGFPSDVLPPDIFLPAG